MIGFIKYDRSCRAETRCGQLLSCAAEIAEWRRQPFMTVGHRELAFRAQQVKNVDAAAVLFSWLAPIAMLGPSAGFGAHASIAPMPLASRQERSAGS